MDRVDQDRRKTERDPVVADTQGPRQMQWDPGAPSVPVERDRLALTCSIIAISSEGVPGHRPAQQLYRGVLRWRRQRGETRRVRRARNSPALREIGRLLDPTPEFEAAALQPSIELRHGVSAVLRMEQCIGERVRIGEIL